jgi:lysophospholipase L1-like esterase
MRALALLLASLLPLGAAEPIKVACVGDSITQGLGAAPGKSYPSQLQELLGAGYKVGNFGVSGRTLLSKGDKPYVKEKAYQGALEMNPDIVIIMLGTNDTKPQNWKFEKEFEADYRALVESFKRLDSKPRIFLCLPSRGPEKPGNIFEGELRKLRPRISRLASTLGCKLIDMNAAIGKKPGMLADEVHPSTLGAGEMAKAAAKAIQAK